MTVYAITDTKKGEQGLRLLIFKLPGIWIFRISTGTIVCNSAPHTSPIGECIPSITIGDCIPQFHDPALTLTLVLNLAFSQIGDRNHRALKQRVPNKVNVKRAGGIPVKIPRHV